MSTNPKTEETRQAAAEIPQPAPTLPPETLVDQLRIMRTQIGEVTPLTPEQRKTLHNRSRTNNAIVQASINVIGATEKVSQALGQAADVRQLVDEANRWTAVEDELRGMLSGVAGANLVRRQRIALITAQAFIIGSQLARDPANAALVPHVQELKRLKSFPRRKKPVKAPASPPAAPTSGTASAPAAGTAATPTPGTPGNPKP
ncbi:MAG TPA: hypothetical protein VI670_23970 [Thermoanaerobaculia bacterium]